MQRTPPQATRALLATASALLALSASPAQAGLVGHTLTCQSTGQNTEAACSPAQATVSGGVEFQAAINANALAVGRPQWSFDFTDDTLTVTSLIAASISGTSFAFIDLTQDFTLAELISVDGYTRRPTPQSHFVSLQNGVLTVDFSDSLSTAGATLVIRLAAEPTELPEPASFGLAALALAGLAGARRRPAARTPRTPAR